MRSENMLYKVLWSLEFDLKGDTECSIVRDEDYVIILRRRCGGANRERKGAEQGYVIYEWVTAYTENS